MNVNQFALLEFEDKTCATAYFVTDRRLLTAGHGLNRESKATVYWSDSEDKKDAQAKIVWISDDKDNIDAAVFEILEETKQSFKGAIRPWFRGAPLTTDMSCRSRGYPRAAEDGGKRTSIPLLGKVFEKKLGEPWVHVTVDSSVKNAEEWRGISGAPVFTEHFIVAVLRGAYMEADGWLQAQPIATLLEDPGFKEATKWPDNPLNEHIESLGKLIADTPYLHWAFSLALGIKHSDLDALGGDYVDPYKIARLYLGDLADKETVTLSEEAQAWLVEEEALGVRKKKKVKVLLDAKPQASSEERLKAATLLVESVVMHYLPLRLLHQGWDPEASASECVVELSTAEDPEAELHGALMDDRDLCFQDLNQTGGALRSRYQLPAAPEAGMEVEHEITKENIVSDLGRKLKLTADSSRVVNCEEVRLELAYWALDAPITRRYFLFLKTNHISEEHQQLIERLQNDLIWLRFYSLSESGELKAREVDSYRSLKGLLHRYETQKKQVDS